MLLLPATTSARLLLTLVPHVQRTQHHLNDSLEDVSSHFPVRCHTLVTQHGILPHFHPIGPRSFCSHDDLRRERPQLPRGPLLNAFPRILLETARRVKRLNNIVAFSVSSVRHSTVGFVKDREGVEGHFLDRFIQRQYIELSKGAEQRTR